MNEARFVDGDETHLKKREDTSFRNAMLAMQLDIWKNPTSRQQYFVLNSEVRVDDDQWRL